MGKPIMTNARYWTALGDQGHIACTLCPHACQLKPGQRGICFGRINDNGEMRLDTYGKSTGFSIDPIEKKPLNHFLPGTPILSFGTIGCNLKCAGCQNWTTSTATSTEALGEVITPEEIAYAAIRKGCRSVAMTYNEPIISLEYAIEVSKACRAQQLRMVAVTSGYISPEARPEFVDTFDGFNVDLKAFSDTFYKMLCRASLEPVLETLKYIFHESKAWLEITTLVIPGHNDSHEDIHALSKWIVENLSRDVPLHLSAFHPDHKMQDVPETTLETLRNAQTIAKSEGLRFVYIGNISDKDGETTNCPSCGNPVIQRDRYMIKKYDLEIWGDCSHCGHKLPGVFDGYAGNWGRKQQSVNMPVWRCMC